MKLLFFLLIPLMAVLLCLTLLRLKRICRALRREEEENQKLRSILQLSSNSAQTELEELRRLRHDLRHYLYITNLTFSAEPPVFTASSPSATGPKQSWVLMSLVKYYRQRAEDLGFQADIRLDLLPPQEELLPDLCLLLSNLLENAIEALQREGRGWLRARSTSASGYLSLVVGNSCSRPLFLWNGRYLSSKRAGRLGVGLATVQEIVRRHGGEVDFSADGTQFRASVFLPYSLQTPAAEQEAAPVSHS